MIETRVAPDTATFHTNSAVRTAGIWLIIGAAIWVPALALHPPLPSETAEFMERVAEVDNRWVTAHWLAAISLSIFALTSLIVLGARSWLTRDGLGMTAWALLPVAALWVATAAVAEATVISRSAISGDIETFRAWDAFAEGRAMGFLGLALAISLIAANELRARGEAALSSLEAWIGVIAGAVGIVSWLLGRPVLGLAIGGPLFVLSAVAIGVWLFWFGVCAVRSSSSPRSRLETRAG